MLVTPVRAQNKYSCALAAIESLTASKGPTRYSQAELIEKFPFHCHRGALDSNKESMAGITGIQDFFYILNQLGYAKEILVGFGWEFAAAHRANIPDGVFLHTTNHHNGEYGGFHCWRLENILPDRREASVINNNLLADGPPVVSAPWDYFETRGCTIHVCIPPQTAASG